MKLIYVCITAVLSIGLTQAQTKIEDVKIKTSGNEQFDSDVACSLRENRLRKCQEEMEVIQTEYQNTDKSNAVKYALVKKRLGDKSDECTQYEGALTNNCPQYKAAKLKGSIKSAEQNLKHQNDKKAKEEYDSKKYERMADERIKKAKEKAAKQKIADEAEAAFDALPDANGKVDDSKLKQGGPKSTDQIKEKSGKKVKSVK